MADTAAEDIFVEGTVEGTAVFGQMVQRRVAMDHMDEGRDCPKVVGGVERAADP